MKIGVALFEILMYLSRCPGTKVLGTKKVLGWVKVQSQISSWLKIYGNQLSMINLWKKHILGEIYLLQKKFKCKQTAD